jgi:tetratricopeptide (TPR) repeat protein
MKVNNTHILFDPQTACLTEKAMFDYIDGKLTAAENHAVEKHLLDCAFCSEAMEGLELVKDRSKLRAAAVLIEERMEQKPGTQNGSGQTRIEGNQKKQDKPGGRLISFDFNTRLAAAAVIILLLGSVIMLRYVLNTHPNEGMAAKQEAPVPVSPPLVSTPDDQTFQKHFEPFPPENRNNLEDEESKPDDSKTIQNGMYGTAQSESSTSSQSSNDAVVTASPAPAQTDSWKHLSDDIPKGPSDKKAEKKDEPVTEDAEKAKYVKETETQRKVIRPGYSKHLDSSIAPAEQNAVTVNADMVQEKSVEIKKEKKKADKSANNSNSVYRALAGSPTLSDQPAYDAREADKTSPAKAAAPASEESDIAATGKKSSPKANPKANSDSTSTLLSLSKQQGDATGGTNQAVLTPDKTVATGTAASNMAPANKAKSKNTNEGEIYNWTATPQTRISENMPPASYSSSPAKPQFKTTLRASGSKSAETAASQILDEAMAAYRVKDFATAIDKFGKVIAIEPANETALFYCGVSYLSLPHPDVANAILNLDAVLTNPQSSFVEAAIWYKALALIKDNRTEDARNLLIALTSMNGKYKSKAESVLKDLNAIKK